jgi:cellulose synthase (UDP-forming)
MEKFESSTLTAAVGILGLVSLVSYTLFLLNPANIGQPYAYALLLIAEFIGMIQIVGLWFLLVKYPRLPALPDVTELRKKLRDGEVHSSVAIFITVAGEPIEVVQRTLEHALRIESAHRTVILDDGGSKELEHLTASLGAEYISRPNKDRTKAGNLNYGLSKVKTDYFAILDCDHVPKKHFLTTMLPYLLQDEKVAFVQSPQYFGNTHTFVGSGSAELQEVFYRHIQPRRNPSNAAFCVGTNVIFRTAAVREIGGIYNLSNSEDIWTALKLHERGWKSIFTPEVLAIGETPETVDGYFRQQNRWATGGFEILLKENPLTRARLTVWQRMQYFQTATFYLTGFSVMIFYLLPLLYTYVGWRPLDVPGQPFVWVLRFLPYYLMTILGNMYLLGRVPKLSCYVMSSTVFPGHVTAFFSALTGKKIAWSVSGVIRKKRDYVTAVAPQILLLLLTAGALPVMLIANSGDQLTPIFAVWMCWNIVALALVCWHSVPRSFQAKPTPLLSSYAS